jgi:hypothetical protein
MFADKDKTGEEDIEELSKDAAEAENLKGTPVKEGYG